MKKLVKKVSVLAIIASLCVSSINSAFAVVIDENTPNSDFQQKVTYTKSASEIVPFYTVTIPDTITLSKDSTQLSYTLQFKDDTSFVPQGKKVSVKIKSAGYSGNLNEFAVWDSRNLQKAQYKIYNTDAAVTPTYYQINDEIASWSGSNWGTITRRIKLTDYYSLNAGTYNGIINYSISLEDK